jgi:crotonobetainyl-CoA:carnitine CoA-transferase CaiB-like acyl-CoA transferase
LCANLLGLIGCDIIKVESSRRPDGGRFGDPRFFDLLHAGHRAVALDFSSESGRSALRALISTADVVIEASRPRALRALGIDAERAVHHGMIWVSITAYGRGPRDEMRVGFGDDVAAGAGLVAFGPDDVPLPAGDALADPLTGVHAALAAARALADPRGWLIDVSMHDVARGAAGVPSASTTNAPVTPPTARPYAGRAPAIGQHTAEILTALGHPR